MEEMLWRKCSSEVLRKLGDTAKLAISIALPWLQLYRIMLCQHTISLVTQQKNTGRLVMYGQYLLGWLQPEFAECGRCSPFGRLRFLNTALSGSLPEGLDSLLDGPELKCTSDSDVMFEIGPVHWITAGPAQSEPVPAPGEAPRTGTSSRPESPGEPAASSAPRLLIEGTANPGFVRVLQERRDGCVHEEPLPFRSDSVRRLMDTFFRLESPDFQQNIAGPSVAGAMPASHVPYFGEVTEMDRVACLYVPGWWPSDEFFERPRRNDWPPKATRDEVRQFGVHLVPTGARGSPTEDLEWRVSFSMSELVTASHLTNTQADSLIVFKTGKNVMGQEGKAVKSYFAKTALFWLCQDLPADAWTCAVQDVVKIISFLENAVKARHLPAFFCQDINLLRFTSRNERKAMLKTLDRMRKYITELLVQNRMICLYLSAALRGETGQVSERQLRVCMTRRSIVRAVQWTCVDRRKTPPKLMGVLSTLLRSATVEQVMATFPIGRPQLAQRTGMFRAFVAAPADVQAQMRLSSSGDGGFIWDAAPLMSLLTEDDLKDLLVNPDAIRVWLRRQHKLPEAKRPAGLPADLRSPRDLCDLLLNTTLLKIALTATGRKLDSEEDWDPHQISPFEEATEMTKAMFPYRENWLLRHYLSQGMDQREAKDRCHHFVVGLTWHMADPETRAEYNRLRTRLPDPWRLGQYMLRAHR